MAVDQEVVVISHRCPKHPSHESTNLQEHVPPEEIVVLDYRKHV